MIDAIKKSKRTFIVSSITGRFNKSTRYFQAAHNFETLSKSQLVLHVIVHDNPDRQYTEFRVIDALAGTQTDRPKDAGEYKDNIQKNYR